MLMTAEPLVVANNLEAEIKMDRPNGGGPWIGAKWLTGVSAPLKHPSEGEGQVCNAAAHQVEVGDKPIPN